MSAQAIIRFSDLSIGDWFRFTGEGGAVNVPFKKTDHCSYSRPGIATIDVDDDCLVIAADDPSKASPFTCPKCGGPMRAERVRVDFFIFSDQGAAPADRCCEEDEFWRFHCQAECRLNPCRNEGPCGNYDPDVLDPQSEQYQALLKVAETYQRPTSDGENISLHPRNEVRL